MSPREQPPYWLLSPVTIGISSSETERTQVEKQSDISRNQSMGKLCLVMVNGNDLVASHQRCAWLNTPVRDGRGKRKEGVNVGSLDRWIVCMRRTSVRAETLCLAQSEAHACCTCQSYTLLVASKTKTIASSPQLDLSILLLN